MKQLNRFLSLMAFNLADLKPALLNNIPMNLLDDFLPWVPLSVLNTYISRACSLKLKGITKTQVEDEISYASKNSIQILSFTDPTYPKLLKYLPDPPPILYLKGKPLTVTPKLSIVGSRNASSYGIAATKYFVEGLTDKNIETVSGLALGIDACAHKYSLESNITTIAVLGTGLNKVYPRTNLGLFRRIEGEGTLLSEFPIDTEPKKYNFPRRNRIIAALGYGVLIVEAAVKSGSLITASFGMDLGKDIFAVPGNIFHLNSSGTNHLIYEGAKPVFNINEILPNIESI